jgi:roadblock/LC7 domain-containing protein
VAFTQAQLNALDRAIAAGVLTVTTSDGKSVTYQSMDELLKVRSAVAAALGGPRRKKVSYLRPRNEGS